MTNESEAAKAVHIAEELLDEIRLQRLELAAVNKCLANLETEHQAMSMALTKLCKRVSHLGPDLQAVLRMLHLDPEALPYPQRLMVQRYRLKSQNEEDGITLALFEQVGTINRQFIEIGSGLSGGNSALLASELGWTGLMLDGDTERMVQVGRRFPNVRAVAAWVTRENINDLIADAGLGGEIDFVSIDLDGNDYWVWRALDVCSPRIVILEFNAAFGPDRALTVQYDPAFDRAAFKDVTAHFYGASLTAFEQLGREKGYRLVVGEPRGANIYLLRNDVAPEISASPVHAVYPDLLHDPQPFFDLITKAQLPLVDLGVDSPEA